MINYQGLSLYVFRFPEKKFPKTFDIFVILKFFYFRDNPTIFGIFA